MRILICGDRNWTDATLIFQELLIATCCTKDMVNRAKKAGIPVKVVSHE